MPYTQFKRVASLLIGKQGSEGLAFRDFRIVFEVEKTDSTESNKGKISIFNLSEATRNKIKKDDLILLNVGYDESYGEELIFAGNITRVSHAKEESNVITKIEAAEGVKFSREIKSSLSYKAGTPAKSILMDLVAIYRSNGISTRSITQDISNDQFVSGFSFVGHTKDAMNKICSKLGLKWTVSNGAIKIVKDGESDGVRAVHLDSESGLIGIPERIDEVKESSTAKKTKPGWKFKALLQPKIDPRCLISVSSYEVGENKVFRVTIVTHLGDTEGEDWTSTIEAVINE